AVATNVAFALENLEHVRTQLRGGRQDRVLLRLLAVADTGEHITQGIGQSHSLDPHQLDLVRPGIRPSLPRFLISIRLRPNLRSTPRGRPVVLQRLRTRVGFALRGISASLRRAIRRSVSSRDSSSAIAFSRAYLPAYFFTSFLRRSFLLMELSFAMDLSSPTAAHAACFSSVWAWGSGAGNGKPNRVSSSRASSSVLAVVVTMMSRPRTFSILS